MTKKRQLQLQRDINNYVFNFLNFQLKAKINEPSNYLKKTDLQILLKREIKKNLEISYILDEAIKQLKKNNKNNKNN